MVSRESNFELLRIISMCLVLIVHSDFLCLGYPTLKELEANPGQVAMRGFFESLSIVCVNLFILISGYFMIKLRFENVLSYVYQCLFYSISIYLFFVIFKLCDLNFHNSSQAILISWFMKNQFVSNYLALMFISPLLNVFFERGKPQEMHFAMFGFSFIAFFMNWLVPVDGGGFLGGYSVFHLMFIYCLGRYIRVFSYLKWFNYAPLVYILIYIVFVAFNTIVFLLFFKYGLPWNVWAYNSPIVIIGSLALFMCFSKIKMHSSVINFLAQSSFSVFLLHTNYFVFPYFKKYVIYLNVENSIFLFGFKLSIFLLVIFSFSILLDQIRKLTYKTIVLVFRNRCKVRK